MVKNIAIIIDSLETGGAEKVAALLSRFLAKEGYNVYFFLDRYNGKRAYYHEGQVIRTCTGGTGNDKWDVRLRASYLSQLKKELNIDVSISFMEDYNFANVLSSKKDKTIVSVRTYLSGRRNEFTTKWKFWRKAIPSLYNKADAVVTMTTDQRNDLRDVFGVNANKIRIIPNAIDNGNLTAGDENVVKDLHEKRFVAIGRLIDVKAQWYAIRAMKLVLKSVPNVHLYILGDGENYGVLQRLSKELNISKHIHIEGFQKSVKKYLAGALALVHTAKAEGFVNAILDGINEGVPIIASDCLSSPRDILAPGSIRTELKKTECAKYGILVPLPEMNKENYSDEFTESEKALADVMIKITKDSAFREHYAIKSKERAKDYTLERVGRKWLDLITSL